MFELPRERVELGMCADTPAELAGLTLVVLTSEVGRPNLLLDLMRAG